MPKQISRYAVSFGLAGCYMPDSYNGPYEFTTRKALAGFIRDQIKLFDLPARMFREVKMRKLWRYISHHGASVAHFSLHHGANVLSFHGLTEAEAREMEGTEA